MAIYPDKKNGVHNGRWRVELQRGNERYRKRWDSHEEAKRDEAAVLASWATGEAAPAPGKAPGAPEVHTFASVIPLAQGNLWEGADSEPLAWAHMKTIARLLGPTTRLDDVDTQMVDALIPKLRKLDIVDATVNRYLSHLRTFLSWAKKRKYRTEPVENIEFAWKKETAGRIRWITHEEESAMAAFFMDSSRPAKHQSAAKAVWALIQIAMETGCRRDELLTVEPKQVNGNRLHLWETKTDTPRTVPMSPAITEKLNDLLQTRTMPSRRGLRSWWLRVKEAIGLADDEDFVFHITRHTCATRLVDAGVNVFVIQQWMGHKRIETTLRYAHVKPQNLEDALVKVGEYKRSANENGRFTPQNTLPPQSPTGAGMGHFQRAA